jgi:hypothetical protein
MDELNFADLCITQELNFDIRTQRQSCNMIYFTPKKPRVITCTQLAFGRPNTIGWYPGRELTDVTQSVILGPRIEGCCTP